MLKYNTPKEYPTRLTAIGLMSGTSLDGLDICLAEFSFNNNKWNYAIIDSTTIAYSQNFKQDLSSAYTKTGRDLMHIDAYFGKWCGQQINEFVARKGNSTHKIDIIGSHGHTVFHEPANGFSTQIGNGAHIAAVTSIPCVNNFRSADVARGGQGAPLVPIGDELLFNEYKFCLNLGGFANISFNEGGKRVAFDICPANMPLNILAANENKEFDENGNIARSGAVNQLLLAELNKLEFYSTLGAKSLGREWFEENFLPIINKFPISNNDLLRTISEHIAIQIARVINRNPKGNVLITGGGAKNNFLIDLIKNKVESKIDIPNTSIIDFKESLIFAFLAVLFLTRNTSCLASVTGAAENSIGGSLYL